MRRPFPDGKAARAFFRCLHGDSNVTRGSAARVLQRKATAILNVARVMGLFISFCDDGRRFAVHADEKLAAFLELEAAIRGCGELA